MVRDLGDFHGIHQGNWGFFFGSKNGDFPNKNGDFPTKETKETWDFWKLGLTKWDRKLGDNLMG